MPRFGHRYAWPRVRFGGACLIIASRFGGGREKLAVFAQITLRYASLIQRFFDERELHHFAFSDTAYALARTAERPWSCPSPP